VFLIGLKKITQGGVCQSRLSPRTVFCSHRERNTRLPLEYIHTYHVIGTAKSGDDPNAPGSPIWLTSKCVCQEGERGNPHPSPDQNVFCGSGRHAEPITKGTKYIKLISGNDP
jgi:hypothetical protein